MNKFIALVLLLLAAPAWSQQLQQKPLTDGFFLAGADGKISFSPKQGCWAFEFASDVNDSAGLIRAGDSLEVLQSNTLEKIASGDGREIPRSIRLWGKITKYKGENFIYPFYFLPLAPSEPNEAATSPAPQPQQPSAAKQEPNDSVNIPDEVMRMLKPKEVVDLAQLKEELNLEHDVMLVNRTGFIHSNPADKQLILSLDSLGRNVEDISFMLLPCNVLESLRIRQSDIQEKARYRIAGIVTKYENRYYILLQRATRIYSYGNFPR